MTTPDVRAQRYALARHVPSGEVFALAYGPPADVFSVALAAQESEVIIACCGPLHHTDWGTARAIRTDWDAQVHSLLLNQDPDQLEQDGAWAASQRWDVLVAQEPAADVGPGGTPTQRQAARFGLPRVIWAAGVYRIVLVLDTEADTLARIPERAAGWDALGVQRWERLAPPTTDEARGAWTCSGDWYHLACALMTTAAPWPAEEDR